MRRRGESGKLPWNYPAKMYLWALIASDNKFVIVFNRVLWGLSCRKIWKDFSLGKYENPLWQMQDKRHGKSKSKENVGCDVAHLYCSLHCCNSPVLLRSCIIFTMFHLLALPRHYFPGDFCLPDDYDKAFPPAPRPTNVTIVSSLLEVGIPPCIMKSIFCILEFSVNVKRT